MQGITSSELASKNTLKSTQCKTKQLKQWCCIFRASIHWQPRLGKSMGCEHNKQHNGSQPFRGWGAPTQNEYNPLRGKRVGR